MSIRLRLLLLFSATLLFLTAIAAYATMVYRHNFAEADQILQSTRRTVDASREAQSSFRAELAAWKNALLRGHEPGQYHHYLSSYYAAERHTRHSLDVLLEVSESIADVHESVWQLAGAHRAMRQALREVLQGYEQEGNPAQAPAEQVVRNTTLRAGELFARVVNLAQQRRDLGLRQLETTRAVKERALLIVAGVGLALSFGLFAWLVDKHVGRPAQRAAYVADVIEHAQRVAEFGTWDWDSSRDDYYWSEGIYRMFGLKPRTKPSLDALMQNIHPEDKKRVVHAIEGAKRHHSAYELEYRVVPPGGAERVVQERGKVFAANRGGPVRMTGIVYDITQRKRAEHQLAVLANFDTLTNLPNRYLFRDRLAHALEQAARSQGRVALLFVDLDEFKAVNDAMGHVAGDELLKLVAGRLRKNLRDGDTLARLGGDEFTVIIENVRDTAQLVRVAKHLRAALGEGFVLAGRQLFVSASMGLAIFPDDAGDADTLLKNADSAMYKAKDQGRNSYQFFTEDLNRLAEGRLDLENRLRVALDRREYRLVYLPRVDLATGRLTGAEALMRWENRQGPVAPDSFIPVLEETGLIIPVGEWVLEQACRAARSWQGKGFQEVRVSVNLSAVQLRPSAELIPALQRALAISGLSSDSLELEVKESILADRRAGAELFQQLRDLEVGLALDDFGTGFSSLIHLKRCFVDTLKIDRSLIRDIVRHGDNAAVVSAIIALARQIGIDVVAEGVESPEQLAFLRDRQCPQIQGLIVAEPMSASDLESWMHGLTHRTEGHFLDALGPTARGLAG